MSLKWTDVRDIAIALEVARVEDDRHPAGTEFAHDVVATGEASAENVEWAGRCALAHQA